MTMVPNIIDRFSEFLAQGAELKVTPEVMIQSASELKTKINKMEKAFESLDERVKATGTYWQGEAGEAFRSIYKQVKPSTEEIIKRLHEHVKDLNTMAGVYEGAEKDVKNIVASLPDDVIL